MRAKLVLACLCSALHLATDGAICISINNGAFENPQTWNCGCDVLNTCDTIIVAHYLTASAPISLGQQLLIINTDASLSLNANLSSFGTIINNGVLNSSAFMLFEPGAEVRNHGNWTSARLKYLFALGTQDTLLNTGFMLVSDTASFPSYYPTVVNTGMITGGHWQLSEFLNQGSVIVSELRCDGLTTNQGSVHCSEMLWVAMSYYSELNGSTDADSIIVTGNFVVNMGTVIAHDLFSVGTPQIQSGILNLPTGQTLYCEGDLINYGTITGSGDICVRGLSANYGQITSTPDICDQTLNVTSPPFLDVNTGSVGPNVNWCANADCTTLSIASPAHTTLNISPNPATDHIRIDGLTGPPRHLALLDLQGRACTVRSSWSGGVLVVERGELPAGTYLLRVVMADGPVHTMRAVLE